MKSLRMVFSSCLHKKGGSCSDVWDDSIGYDDDSRYSGMTKQGMTASSDEGDEVERSLELLDRVLSEFDVGDVENANLVGGGVGRAASSEDDGYMSLNGRRKPPLDTPPPPSATEAQRIIANLLPRVSPCNSSKRSSRRGKLHASLTLGHEERLSDCADSVPAATQTTIPKTRHQRPYGWQNGRVPPRTVATTDAAVRHREVRRDTPREDRTPPRPPDQDLGPVQELSDANFSDDSLDGVPPPPPPHRASIAWEVPLDDEHALYTPGSTKVIGRRRRRSTDRSSSGSVCRVAEEWPDPPTGTEDGSISPLSDSSHLDSSGASRPDEQELHEMSSGGTYVVRKHRRRKAIEVPEKRTSTSSTFDNIKSLLREGLIEGLDEAPPDFQPPEPPSVVRVVSLPSLDKEGTEDGDRLEPSEEKPTSAEGCTQTSGRVSSEEALEEAVTPSEAKPFPVLPEEEEESQDSKKQDVAIQATPEHQSDTDSDSGGKERLPNGTDTSSNEALMRELNRAYDTESINNNIETAHIEQLSDPWLTAKEITRVQVSPETRPKEFKVKVEVVHGQHEFGPLPPSPVDEAEEYADVVRTSPTPARHSSADRKESFYRCSEPAASDPLGTRFHSRDPSQSQCTSSLKTRSMDAGFSRNHRSHQSSSRRDGVGERRTLPTELQGGPRRRTYQKRLEPHMQVSCSLPETPIFARGCDIPRTPHRKAPDVPPHNSTAPRLSHHSSTATYRSTGMSLGEAMAGAELLRLAGGPGRGWYPRHRQPRPASVEHLDRLPHPWAPHDARKPQTLPPNLTPKFFHRSPRDALRRVTSLLIRKGNTKDKRDALSPTTGLAGEAEGSARQKKGFFRNWWKRSRHYSLDQQQ